VDFLRKPALNEEALAFARSMRHEQAPAEAKLWSCLRNRRLNGFKFRRQHPHPPFIADFYCHGSKLIVEVDGASHYEREAYDASRTAYLQRNGMRVVRFLNVDVRLHLVAVLEAILSECERGSEACGTESRS
jgi:very-short-patch-repair endonuclease